MFKLIQMKKLLTLMVLAAVLASCGKSRTSGGDTDLPATLETDSLAPTVESDMSDSVRCEIRDTLLESTVSLPPFPQSVRPAVGAWLSDLMGGSYKGDVTDLQAMAEYYCKAHADTLKTYLDDAKDYESEYVQQMAFDARVKKIFETDKIVTYNAVLYYDQGGAHPSTLSFDGTFCKSDGQLLTWDSFLPGKKAQLSRLIVQNLKAYFEVNTDSALSECLLIDFQPEKFPLPVGNPCFLEKGVAFNYQQYEIASYACGMPSGVLPYGTVKSMLNDWAGKLIPDHQ